MPCEPLSAALTRWGMPGAGHQDCCNSRKGGGHHAHCAAILSSSDEQAQVQVAQQQAEYTTYKQSAQVMQYPCRTMWNRPDITDACCAAQAAPAAHHAEQHPAGNDGQEARRRGASAPLRRAVLHSAAWSLCGQTRRGSRKAEDRYARHMAPSGWAGAIAGCRNWFHVNPSTMRSAG